MSFLMILAGLVVLTVGAEALVRGASRLATATGLSPLVVGLTVVAYGTSMPEMAVSMVAGMGGQNDIALGNVVGSNIINVLFILGLSALIVPLTVSSQLVRLDVPLMIGVSILTLLVSLDGTISRIEGTLFFTGMIAYTGFLIYHSRRTGADKTDNKVERVENPAAWLSNIAWVVGGLIMLVLGAQWFITGCMDIARQLGISELIIGLTLVAAGTSLPEVATSIVASIRGERDIAIGNVVGSNIFNILGVLGVSGMVSASGITISPVALQFDIPVMIAVAVGCLPIFYTGYLIARWEGFVFLTYYGVYTLYLFLSSTQNTSLPVFNQVVLLGAIPATALILLITTIKMMRTQQAET
ncbi:MAG: calcium/sodium antiporter [candidate division Zixibacteria bacterium]|nr:calcium/sodium antiporter [candidate division Zixibacteria bacterium]